MYQILIVEDDRGLNQGIALALQQEGVSFLQAYNAAEGRDFWEKGHVDMALLDVNLPDGTDMSFWKRSERPHRFRCF